MRDRTRSRSQHSRPATCRRTATLGFESLEARELLAGDMVIQWNDHLIETIRRDTTRPGPTWASRNGAIMHLAVYDAVNAITQTHSSYVTTAKASSTASKEAAVATAAHDTLVAMYPGQKSRIDAWWTQSLASVPDGAAETAGIAIGRQAAADMLALRANDGSTRNVTYTVNPAPGHWSPDPLNPTQTALGANWGFVKPFAIDDPHDYMVEPPALTSSEYAAAFNEVESLGAKNSTTRTADQTQIGVFWAYDRAGMGPPMNLYNQVTQTIAMQRNNSLVDNARLFALVNLSMADSGITSWSTKYHHDLWRPITGIRRGNADGNPATVADPSWEPLGAPGGGVVRDFTPPFPAFTSGHATFGAATFRTLANFYGTDAMAFTLTSDELPGVTRSYTSFSQASAENGRSRIYLGIHWNFDDSLGRHQGNQLADYVHQHFLKPLPPDRSVLTVQNDGAGFVTHVFPSGAADISLRRSLDGHELEVVQNATNTVLFRRDLNDLNTIRFTAAANRASDMLVIDQGYGGSFSARNPVSYVGGAGDQDRVWYAGSNQLNDVATLDGNLLKLPGLSVPLTHVTYVGLAGHGGDDVLQVKGDQSGRRVDILGQAGNDRYVITSRGGTISLEEHQGSDTLDLAGMPVGVAVDLSLSNGQAQPMGNGVLLQIQGLIANVVGTAAADRITGNSLANQIWGRSGHDYIWGQAGADRLYGEDGNDVLVGGDGDDLLSGGNHYDILIGGLGQDTLNGGANGNILIGGVTSHDEHQAALAAILSEWTSPRSKTIRIANLTNGSGSTDRRNGNYYLSTSPGSRTVWDDALADTIQPPTSSDWLIVS